MRIDVISVMRGVDSFEEIWVRRTTVEVAPGESYEVISLPDLVRSKKTQIDKDWPMIRRPFLASINLIKDRDLEAALDSEEKREREVDREYWKPLRQELENLRLGG
jgi:hypothetical protein